MAQEVDWLSRNKKVAGTETQIAPDEQVGTLVVSANVWVRDSDEYCQAQ